MNDMWILAQAPDEQAPSGITSAPVTEQETQTSTVASDPNAPIAPRPPARSPYGNLILIGLMFVVMYFLLFRGPRKREQEQKKMVQSLERNDRVRTIGGILGTIVDVRDDEITLKIDESNNTKIKISPSAIGRNLSKEKK